jgi:hypothetical protein
VTATSAQARQNSQAQREQLTAMKRDAQTLGGAQGRPQAPSGEREEWTRVIEAGTGSYSGG